MALSVDSKLGDLLDNEASKAILEKHAPGISTHPMIGQGRGFPLRMIAPFSGGQLTNEMLDAIDADLATLG